MMHGLWSERDGQDIAEYAVMAAVILVLVAATVRLIGSRDQHIPRCWQFNRRNK
jgi:Flp pilus assembly pilin Flp